MAISLGNSRKPHKRRGGAAKQRRVSKAINRLFSGCGGRLPQEQCVVDIIRKYPTMENEWRGEQLLIKIRNQQQSRKD